MTGPAPRAKPARRPRKRKFSDPGRTWAKRLERYRPGLVPFVLEGLAERIKSELGKPVTVIATGGLADLFDQHTDVFDAIEPDLTVQGLGLLHQSATK